MNTNLYQPIFVEKLAMDVSIEIVYRDVHELALTSFKKVILLFCRHVNCQWFFPLSYVGLINNKSEKIRFLFPTNF